MGIAYNWNDFKNALLSTVVKTILICVGALMIVLILLQIIIYRRATAPVTAIQETVREYKDSKDSGKVAEKMSQITVKNELGLLSRDISELAKEIDFYTKENIRLAAERERVSAELDLARKIQADQLPSAFPAFPDRTEFDIFASMKPAREVGGDFYDFFMVDDDHIALVIADVSDKGIPACLFMMMAKVLLKNQLQAGKSPAEALADVNAQLMESNKNNQFVTVWTAVLELSTGRGIEANAGHEHPALRRAYGSYELVEYRHSLTLAVMRGTRFKDYEFRLYPGESLFVYTDGVTEASNRENQIFKTDRMLDALNRAPGADPEAAIANVYEGIAAFVGDADQFDDITMLCFHYNGPQEIEQEAE